MGTSLFQDKVTLVNNCRSFVGRLGERIKYLRVIQDPSLSVSRLRCCRSGLEIRWGAMILYCDGLSQVYFSPPQKLPWLHRLNRTLV